MAGPAPKEIQGIPTVENKEIVHLPTQESEWREGVVQHVQKAGPSFTTNEATPHAAQPIPSSKALEEVGAERVGAEPIIDIADITDIMGKTAGHVVKSVGGEEGPLTHVETAPGPKVISFMQERARRLFRRGRQRSQKAA